MTLFSRLAAATAGVTAVFMLSGCPPPAPPAPVPGTTAPVTVDVARLISVKVGQTAVIRLGSNPATGYRWEVVTESLADMLAVVGETTYTPDPATAGTVGAGGTETITLMAKKPGYKLVSFAYRRPGQRKAGKRVVLEFDVLSPSQ